jgi:ATP-dependent Lhr-like helicase
MDINVAILAALQGIGIGEFTEVQKRAIPEILSGKDVLVIAPSGLGKTEAAMVPILHRILEEKPKPISCVYITPLRALNRDMLKRMKVLGDKLDLNVAVRHGDTPASERARHLKHPPDILITTPETLQILLIAKKMKEHLRNARYVVVDEIHELANNERGEQLSVGLERLSELCGKRFQRIGLSATVGSPHEIANYLTGADPTRKAVLVDVPIQKEMEIRVVCPKISKGDGVLAEKISVEPGVAASLRFSRNEIEGHRSSLLFVNTRNNAEFLSSRFNLMDEDFKIGVHHGSLSKGIRIQMEDEFKLQALKALICTSSLELGIDIGSVNLTVQYNSPRQVTRFLQRIGRSGHAVSARSKGMIIATEPDEIAEASAIASRSSRRELEPTEVRENNLSVLANQLVAFVIEDRISVKNAYRIIRRAYPFRNLDFKVLLDVIELLNGLRLLRFDGELLGRSSGSYEYFFGNISMIPDEKNYMVRDISTRRIIGTLDERFVSTFGEDVPDFVMRGVSWHLVEIKNDEVLAEPKKALGTIPSWVGEDIPVPYEVAMQVGAFRRLRELGEHSDKACRDDFLKYLEEQEKSGIDIPHDRLVTIEGGSDLIVINACFGTKVNETLGQLISSFLSARLGETVRVQIDPYRVILELPRPVEPSMIEEILRSTDTKALPGIVRMVVKNSGYFRWQFIRTAKKFGALKKGADVRGLSPSKFIQAYEDTPLIDEAIDKTIWNFMDIGTTSKVLKAMQKGDIGLKITAPSPIGLRFGDKGREFMMPSKPDAMTLGALKRRLEGERVTLFCLNCKGRRGHVVKDLPDEISCPQCGGVLLAAIPRHRTQKDLPRRRGAEMDRKELSRLHKNANLVMAHGKKAVLALMARGIGADAAARILRNLHETEEEFLRDLLKAEISYARTRRFWD